MGEIGKAALGTYTDAVGLRTVGEPASRSEEVGRRRTASERADRDRLVQRHLPLVYKLSRRYWHCGEPLEDLAQVGTIGLLKAIEKFDSSRGVSFTTYAVPVVLGEIKNYLRDHGWAVKVPRKLQRNKLQVSRAAERLGQVMGRAPTVSEIAEDAGLTQEEVFDTFEVTSYGRPLSLDAEHLNGADDRSRLMDSVGNEDPEYGTTSDRADLESTLNCLDRREKTIIYLKFYADLPQTEIAKRLGISQMHVSRLQRGALEKLREGLSR